MDIKDNYSWEQFERDSKRIAYWAKEQNCKDIYGIPRGGLVLGVRLSHLLGLPLLMSQKKVKQHTLVVDDIIDTGGTIEKLFSIWGKRSLVASIFIGGNPKIRPDFFLHKKKAWIVFPWETEASSQYDGMAFEE